MKKNILIISTVFITLSLIAFGVTNSNFFNTDSTDSSDSKTIAIKNMDNKIFTEFIYDVGPRFSPIKKRDIENAITMETFFDAEHIKAMVTLKSVSITTYVNEKYSDILETGYTKALTEAQIDFLKSLDYSTSIRVRADYEEISKKTGKIEDSYSTPHLTIIPETQVKYSEGKDALKTFLRENSIAVRENVDPEKLQPAKLFFTVNTEGNIENVRLDRSSNYPLVDKKMIELISKVPGTWKPAENYKGEKVNQELVVSFGLMGC